MARLTDRESHFDFGENWASYAELIDGERTGAAEEHLLRLVGGLRGKSFIDIGSGSGLFSLAALRLGASKILALDIDEESVATTTAVLEKYWGSDGRWNARQQSVFDLAPDKLKQFDVVYSWGVLHHTGDMWGAIDKAAEMTKPGGIFVFALYERSPLCGFWRVEKRAYMKSPPLVQKVLRGGFIAAYAVGLLLTGRNPRRRFHAQNDRGMEVNHDVHDWLGGYPYESTSSAEVEQFMTSRAFDRVREYPRPVPAFGILGSGCSEYVYRRRQN